jgi:SPP1 gp7 family putative phage head morphogenesis protein
MALPDDFWITEQQELAALLLKHLLASALKGAETALAVLEEDAGIGVDWGLVNEAARDWAKRASLQLAGDIGETSRRFTTQTIADWIESGAPLDDLIGQLEPMFGKVRAEMVASTEVTRAFAEGNRTTWKESGVVDGMRWMASEDELMCPICGDLAGKVDTLDGDFDGNGPPPAHPRCRCYLQPVVN